MDWGSTTVTHVTVLQGTTTYCQHDCCESLATHLFRSGVASPVRAFCKSHAGKEAERIGLSLPTKRGSALRAVSRGSPTSGYRLTLTGRYEQRLRPSLSAVIYSISGNPVREVSVCAAARNASGLAAQTQTT